MRWGVVFLLIVATVGYGDSPWIPNVRVSVEAPWDTLNQGESCFDVYGDSIVSICNTAERADVPIAPYGYSFDEGNSFVQTPFTDEAAGIIWHTDPVIGVDDSGHVHMLIQYSLDEIRHYVSRDGGMSWCDTTRVTPHYGVDKPWMVVNKNEVYVVWQQTDGEIGIWCAKSTDYGGSFEASRIWERMYITALCMDESENLHLALVDWTTGYDIYYRKSTDKGETWLPEVRLSDWEYVESYGDRAPINSITARGDVVFVTWVDTRYGGWDVMGIRSTDGGTTWGTPFVVNDITEGGQCKGWGHFDEYGGLHVTYYHTPDWPTDRNSLFSFRSQYSPDSGATFNPSIRVSDGSFASLANFLGEYHICVSDSFYLYAIWTDGRNGDYNDLYFSKALLSELVVRLPLLSIYEYQWEDSGEDGHADPGDTLSLSLSLWNSGGDAGAVTVNLSSNEPVVTFIDSSADFGAILSDSIKDNRDDPFIFVINQYGCAILCTFDLSIRADTLDFSEILSLMLEPLFISGDCNGDSCISFLDVSYLSDYVSLGGPSPFGSGDVNQDGSVDMNDPVYLVDYLFNGGSPPCGVTPPLCTGTPSPHDTVEVGDREVCCSTTILSVPITLKNQSFLVGMTFPLKYDTSLVVCDSVKFNNLFQDWSQESRICEDSGTILMAAWTPGLVSPYQLPPGGWNAATLWFSSRVSPDAQDTLSGVDTMFVLPDHKLSLVDSNQILLRPMVATGTLDIALHCGDVNQDCGITFADALYLKNYYYQTPPGSPEPICEGDVNLDGRITFGDALYIKNYYYQTPPGSPPPCEPPLTTAAF